LQKPYFPCALKIEGRACLVIGDDREAQDKSCRLADCGARVTVVAPFAEEPFLKTLNSRGILVERRAFRTSDLEETFLVVYCEKDREQAASLHKLCRRKGILLCAVDLPEYCDFINVSLFSRGALQIAVSTGGVSPALSRKIRLGLESSLKKVPLEEFLDHLAALRTKVSQSAKTSEERRRRLIEAVDDFQFLARVRLPTQAARLKKSRRKSR